MGDDYEVIPLRSEFRSVKLQSKYVGRNQLEKNTRKRDFMKSMSKNSEKKLEKNRSYKIFGKYKSEGEEVEGSRLYKSAVAPLVLTRSKTVIRDFHTVNLVVQY